MIEKFLSGLSSLLNYGLLVIYLDQKMFTPITPKKLSDQVVDQITSAILTEKMPPGARLPSERELTQLFTVSRQAIRDAMQRLVGMGLVEVRKARGAFVRAVTPELMRQPLAQLLDHELGGLLNFVELRNGLEGMAVAQAAERATEDDLVNIEEILANLQAAAEARDWEAFSENNVSFHLAIVSATHDPFMLGLLDILTNMLRSVHGVWPVILEEIDSEVVNEEHRAIAQAIRSRDPRKAREAMRHHLVMTRTMLERLHAKFQPIDPQEKIDDFPDPTMGCHPPAAVKDVPPGI